jgi:hypothetical protein
MCDRFNSAVRPLLDASERKITEETPSCFAKVFIQNPMTDSN